MDLESIFKLDSRQKNNDGSQPRTSMKLGIKRGQLLDSYLQVPLIGGTQHEVSTTCSQNW